MSKDTLFTNENQTASGAVDYVKDVFDDVSLPATNNTGLTSSAANNPLGAFFANPDCPRLEAKQLFIKDLVLIEDRNLWIQNKPTYQIIWTEPYPAVIGYVFGNIRVMSRGGQVYVQCKNIGDGFGVNGVISRAAFLVNPDENNPTTGRVVVDGVNGNTLAFSNLAYASYYSRYVKYAAVVHSSSNETKDLHDIRLVANQAGIFYAVGAIVMADPSQSTVEFLPGTTYVNKSKLSQTTGTTTAVASFGNALGGKALLYKASGSGYFQQATSVTTMVTTAQGSSGTNLLTVTTGHGASFKAGYGVIAYSGSTAYVGNVLSVSTDTLTMGVTVPFGINGTALRYFSAGTTHAISSSLMALSYQIDASNMPGFTMPILEPRGNWGMWGSGFRATFIDSAVAFAIPSGAQLQVEGRFQAADVEMIGNGILHATFSVNGIATFGVNEGQTGAIKRTIFTDGAGFNSFALTAGTSMGAVGIAKINLYTRKHAPGISFGFLAEYEQRPTYGDRGTLSATIMPVGMDRRIYADQLFLAGSWVRGATTNAPGGAFYYGASTTSICRVEYYGKNFGIVGVPGGGTLTLDGGGIGLTFGFMHSVATEGFHTVQYTVASGTTALIAAFDYCRQRSDILSLQDNGGVMPGTAIAELPTSDNGPQEIYCMDGNGSGGNNTYFRRFSFVLRHLGTAISYIDSSNDGAVFTINAKGKYSITYTDSRAGALSFGISRNTRAYNTPVDSLTYKADRLIYISTPSGVFGTATWVGDLEVGDEIRPHAGTDSGTATGDVSFRISKVG